MTWPSIFVVLCICGNFWRFQFENSILCRAAFLSAIYEFKNEFSLNFKYWLMRHFFIKKCINLQVRFFWSREFQRPIHTVCDDGIVEKVICYLLTSNKNKLISLFMWFLRLHKAKFFWSINLCGLNADCRRLQQNDYRRKSICQSINEIYIS